MPAPRQALALVAAAAGLPLAVAYAAQYWGGLAPCDLCLYQRYPYFAALALAILGVALIRRRAAVRLMVALAGGAFLVSGAVAAFHVGVEEGWWQGTAACGGIDAGSAEEFKAQVLAAPLVRCDEVPWSLFGISMAGYNFIYAGAAGLAALGAAGVASRRR